MKLALLCPDLVDAPFGGIPMVSRQVLRQLDRIAAERHIPLEIDVWALHDQRKPGVDLARAFGLSRPVRQYRAFGSSRAAMLGAAASTRDSVDLVFTTHIGLGPVGRLLRRGGGELVQFLHGVEAWRRLPVHQRAGLAATSGLLSNSAFTRDRFLGYNPEYRGIPSRVTWLGLPLDIEPQGDCSVPQSAPRALIVGRMCGQERYKGHEELLGVWGHVRRFFPDACLDIVGDGNARPALEARAERLGHLRTGAVRFWGRVSFDELRARYREASVFVMPSRGEGFGIVYLEAMANGKPCIASLDDAAREVIVQDETGLLVRYGDREGLAAALFELFGDARERGRLGEGGRARVRATFTERHFGERVFRALASIVPSSALGAAL